MDWGPNTAALTESEAWDPRAGNRSSPSLQTQRPKVAPAEGTQQEARVSGGQGTVREAIPWLLWGQEAVCTWASSDVSSGVRSAESLPFQELHTVV